MQKIIVAIASQIAMGFLKSLAQELWNAFWDVVFDAVRDAEKKWTVGAVRKNWVIEQIMKYLTTKKKMNGIQKWAMRILLERVVDAIIAQLNQSAGHDWGQKVLDLKAYLASKIPFID